MPFGVPLGMVTRFAVSQTVSVGQLKKATLRQGIGDAMRPAPRLDGRWVSPDGIAGVIQQPHCPEFPRIPKHDDSSNRLLLQIGKIGSQHIIQ